MPIGIANKIAAITNFQGFNSGNFHFHTIKNIIIVAKNSNIRSKSVIPEILYFLIFNPIC
jgi:hypothetical protein